MNDGKDKRALAEWFDRLWGDAEKSIEDTVAKALIKVRLPKREEIEKLNGRLDALQKRVEALSK